MQRGVPNWGHSVVWIGHGDPGHKSACIWVTRDNGSARSSIKQREFTLIKAKIRLSSGAITAVAREAVGSKHTLDISLEVHSSKGHGQDQ
jgi:hypothetical protein